MTLERDRPEPNPATPTVPRAVVTDPMDYLVNALGRAVARKQPSGSNDTENTT